ncbi:MAG: IS110 family transposase, partial [Gammaproteobacteria bacterium]|nr:IS110 family transposase [Gammaproteobacteria bacterium]
MNTQNGTPINVGIDTSQDQLDIYVRPQGDYFSHPNTPAGARAAV